MQLNTLSPAEGEKKSRKRVGRGIGSGLVKLVAVVTRVKKSTFRWFSKVGLKVVKCLYNVVYLK
jgi:LSU ribosomal protein L15P